MIYSCCSRSSSLQRVASRTDSFRLRQQIFKALVKSPKNEILWRTSFLKLANNKTDSRRFREQIFRNLIKSSKDEILWRTPSLKLANIAQASHLFRSGSYSRVAGLFLIKSLPLTKSIYRNFEVYRCLNFINGLKNQWAVTIGDGTVLNQDKNYLILRKLDLEYLIPNENNSAEEIIAALLLHWQSNLNSRKLNVVFYRCLKFPEDSQWMQTQSFLINALLAAPGDGFPSPKSFLI